MLTAPVQERSTVDRIDVAFEVGQWSYWNDAPCPYGRDEDVAEWYRGYVEASRSDEQATNHRRSTTE